MKAAFRQGRSLADGAFGRRYLPAATLPATDPQREDDGLYVWFEPQDWGLAPDLQGRQVAIVANSDVRGCGGRIDSFDEVIRLNNMRLWRHVPEDDGVRATIWAGLPWPDVVPTAGDRARAAPGLPSCFPEIASQLSVIWAVTPYHISVRFVDFLQRHGLRDRLFISGGGLYFFDDLSSRLPPDLFRTLFTIAAADQPGGLPNLSFNFDLLLTGVRAAFFCALSGAREIGLFGFDFYADSRDAVWPGHDLALNRQFLAAVRQLAPAWGCRIDLF